MSRKVKKSVQVKYAVVVVVAVALSECGIKSELYVYGAFFCCRGCCRGENKSGSW